MSLPWWWPPIHFNTNIIGTYCCSTTVDWYNNLLLTKWKALKCQTLGAAVHVIVLVCWLESITVSWTIEAVMLVRCVWFCSYLCKVCSRVSEALLLILRTLSLSLSPLITLPQTVRLFYVSLRSQAPQQQYTVLSFLRCEGMATVTNWSLHVHHGITLCAYLSQTHRPIALHCMHYSITLWAYLSEPLVKDSHKRSTENTIPRAPSHVITHYRYVCVTERYTETLHVKKMADLVAVSL